MALIRQEKRILWIDYSKTIGIFLVILGHIKIAPEYSQFIYSFHMPLFFIISGFLEKNKSIKETIIVGLKTLLIPYLIMYLLSFIIWIPSRILWHKELYENEAMLNGLVLKPLVGMLFGVGYDTRYSTMMNIPLWFLFGLFFVKIIHSVLIKIFRGKAILYVIASIGIIGLVYLLKQTGVDLLFSIDSAIMTFPFFATGYLCKKFNGLNSKIVLNIIIINISFGLTLLLCKYNGRIDINGFNYGKNIIIFYISGISGTVMTICISMLFNKRLKIITIISNGTIFILAFHSYFAAMVIRIIRMYGQGLNLVVGITISVITLLSMVIPIIIVRKYMPIIIGKRK
jgi:fucose 4-O-acetylase-like acetyltransferase